MSCSLAFNGNSAFCFLCYSHNRKSTPASARSRNSLESKSHHCHQANKKHPSFDECSLLAGDEARTRDILLGKDISPIFDVFDEFVLFPKTTINSILQVFDQVAVFYRFYLISWNLWDFCETICSSESQRTTS